MNGLYSKTIAMKTLVLIFLCLASIETSLGQMYERTGKNLGLYFSAQPLSYLNTKGTNTATRNFNGSVGVVHMLRPGIYSSVGYTFSKTQTNTSRYPSAFPMQSANGIDASLLFDKQLLKLVNGRRVHGSCHYLSIGLIIGPEYHYMFGNEQVKNESLGEFAGIIGLSFFHFRKSMSKRVKANTKQFDLFFRNGFTPLFTVNTMDGQQKYYRQEIGVRVRLIRHQVSNFLE